MGSIKYIAVSLAVVLGLLQGFSGLMTCIPIFLLTSPIIAAVIAWKTGGRLENKLSSVLNGRDFSNAGFFFYLFAVFIAFLYALAASLTAAALNIVTYIIGMLIVISCGRHSSEDSIIDLISIWVTLAAIIVPVSSAYIALLAAPNILYVKLSVCENNYVRFLTGVLLGTVCVTAFTFCVIFPFAGVRSLPILCYGFFSALIINLIVAAVLRFEYDYPLLPPRS